MKFRNVLAEHKWYVCPLHRKARSFGEKGQEKASSCPPPCPNGYCTECVARGKHVDDTGAVKLCQLCRILQPSSRNVTSRRAAAVSSPLPRPVLVEDEAMSDCDYSDDSEDDLMIDDHEEIMEAGALEMEADL